MGPISRLTGKFVELFPCCKAQPHFLQASKTFFKITVEELNFFITVIGE